jgi:hypothetical protein
MLNPDDFVYLPALVVKEILAGHEVEIVGGICIHIRDASDYKKIKDSLAGKFGEVIVRGTVTRVATRNPPPWALQIIHEHIWEKQEMREWMIPQIFR